MHNVLINQALTHEVTENQRASKCVHPSRGLVIQDWHQNRRMHRGAKKKETKPNKRPAKGADKSAQIEQISEGRQAMAATRVELF